MIFFLVLSLVTSDSSITINLNQNNGNELTLHHQRNLSKRNEKCKVFCSFFWDYNGVTLKELVPAGTTIYVSLLINKLYPEIKKTTMMRFNFNWRHFPS